MKNYLFPLAIFSQTICLAETVPCETATTITCGLPISTSTINGDNLFDKTQYSGTACAGNTGDPYDGNDKVFKLVVKERMVIHIYLSMTAQTHKDLDVFLFRDCEDIGHCLAGSIELNDNIYTESIEYIADSDTYYIVIDGKEANQNAPFTLRVECECSCIEDLNPLYARPIRCENFDVYENKAIDPQSIKWRKWRTFDNDGVIETIGSEKVMRIKRTPPANTDVYYSLTNPEAEPARHRISWLMYIEEGATGAYGFLNKLPFPSVADADPVYDVFFITQDRGRVVMNGDTVANFTYDGGAWNDVMQIVDPALDTIEIWINNHFVFGSKYSAGAVGDFEISGIRFFTIANSNFLIDHICMWEKGDPIIIKCEGDSVCTSNGGSFEDLCEAEQELYTDLEFQECEPTYNSHTVCDYGGSAIYRSDEFIDTFSLNDEIPGTILTDQCVLNAFAGGYIPSYFRAQIKVYHNDSGNQDGDQIQPSFNTHEDDSTFLFVFSCSYNPDLNEVTQIYLGQVVQDTGACFFKTDTDEPGIYYMVAMGRLEQTYSLSIFPGGDCNTFNPIKCDTMIRDIPSENNYDINNKGDYATCYNGTRTYEGNDIVFNFDITEPTIVNIHLSATDKKAVFLYNFLCAKNCLDYAETPPGGGNADILNVSLLTGRYYIIVDSDSTTTDSFNLSMDCISDLIAIPRTYISGDTNCLVEDQAENIHIVNIPIAASKYLNEEAYVIIGYSDPQANKKEVIAELYDDSDNRNFLLPKDFIGDGDKCGFLLNDTISFTLHTPHNGSDYWIIPCRATYEELIPPAITAKGNFIPASRSVVDSLIDLNLFSYSIEPTFKNFSPQAQSAIFEVFSPEGYSITKDVDAMWLDVVYQEGNTNVTVSLVANPDQEKRETDLLVSFPTDPPLYSTIHISQDGPCIDPIINLVTSTGENTFCEGETVYLIANFIKGSGEFYSFDWSNNDSLQQIAFPAQLNANNFNVTVTEKECFETASASININVIEAPSVSAGSDITVCPGTLVELNATSTVAGEYKWSTGQTTSQIFVNPVQETTYRVSVTVAGETCDGIDSVTVFMHPVAEWSIHTDSLIKCNGDANGQLSIVANNGSQPQSILWSNNNTSSVISNLPSGQYFVSITDTFGCLHLDTLELDDPSEIQFSDVVVVNPVNGNNGEIHVTVSGGFDPYEFAWYDSLNVKVSNNDTLLNQPAGCYTLVVTDARKCKAQLDSCIELIISTIWLGDDRLVIFPNPTDGKIYVRCKQSTVDKVDWKIFDLLGRHIMNGAWGDGKEINEVIDLEGNGPGYYLLTLESEKYKAMEVIILY